MVEHNEDVQLKCKRCGQEWPAQQMRLDKNGKDMICAKCNEQATNRDKALRNVKLY